MSNHNTDDIEFEYPEAWKPEPGDIIKGVFEELDSGPSKYSPTGVTPIAVIRDDDGVRHSVWLSATVLRNEFKKARPQPGDPVAVKYIGPVKDGKGKVQYQHYRVKNLTPKKQAVDWGHIDELEEAAAEPEPEEPDEPQVGTVRPFRAEQPQLLDEAPF